MVRRPAVLQIQYPAHCVLLSFSRNTLSDKEFPARPVRSLSAWLFSDNPRFAPQVFTRAQRRCRWRATRSSHSQNLCSISLSQHQSTSNNVYVASPTSNYQVPCSCVHTIVALCYRWTASRSYQTGRHVPILSQLACVSPQQL